MLKTSVESKGINKRSRAHNLTTLEGIHKKNIRPLETSLLKNCGKLSSLSPKKLREFTLKK